MFFEIRDGYIQATDAIDAETDGHEGAYYTWTAEDLEEALPGSDGALFRAVYGLEGPPTFEGSRYVLFLHTPVAEQARAGGLSEAELRRRLEPGRRALIEARARRERPLTDDKVLADWNGLTIGALARAGARLAEPRYLAAAERAAELLWQRSRSSDGALQRVLLGGRPSVPALQEDYAFLAQGLVALYDETGKQQWLGRARELTDAMLQRFFVTGK